MLTFRDDIRSAFRALLAAPVFTVAAIAILALGVGGSTGVFTLLYSVAIMPLPYDAPWDAYGSGMECSDEPLSRWDDDNPPDPSLWPDN